VLLVCEITPRQRAMWSDDRGRLSARVRHEAGMAGIIGGSEISVICHFWAIWLAITISHMKFPNLEIT